MFIFFVIVFLIAAIAAGTWLLAKPEHEVTVETYSGHRTRTVGGEVKDFARTTAIAAGSLAVLLLLLSSLVIVPANHVGVVTLFGSWGGTVDSGINWVAPWSTVDEFTTRNNKSVRDQAEGNDNCVSVKFKGNASGCMDLTVLYTIDKNRAEVLWRGWGGFDRINGDLVNRSTDDAVNQVLSQYAPEDVPQNRVPITEQLHKALNDRISPQGVHLESVTLGDMHLPQDVQDRINSILAQDAKTKVAEGQRAEAIAQAAAAQERQKGLTPEALIQECLNAAREIKPQYFDCGLSSAAGQRPSLIISQRDR